MRSLIVLAAVTFTAGISAAASPHVRPEPEYLEQSDPFNLIVLSSNNTLNGTHLYSCHEGAAIQGLCTNSSRTIREGVNPSRLEPHHTRYFLNFTDQPEHTHSETSEDGPGILTWAFSHMTVSCSMTLRPSSFTNVITAMFYTGTHGAVKVSFDKDDKMFMWGRRDESVLPNWLNMGYQRHAYYNWYICTTNEGYYLETVTWVTGGQPLNPSCQKVDIKRVPEEDDH